MTGANEKMGRLRQLLAEKFPAAPVRRRDFLNVGGKLAALPDGGLLRSAITEMVAAQPSSGTSLLLLPILRELLAQHRWMALIDGRNAFDPTSLGQDLSRFLWVRSLTAARAMEATDLILRDGNLDLVVLDLRLNAPRELGKIPSTSWYRLQRLVEERSAVLVVMSRAPLVPCAARRLGLNGHWDLDALDATEEELSPDFTVHLQQRGEVALSLFKTG